MKKRRKFEIARRAKRRTFILVSTKKIIVAEHLTGDDDVECQRLTRSHLPVRLPAIVQTPEVQTIPPAA